MTPSRLQNVIWHILGAADRPLRLSDLHHFAFGFGYEVDTFDIRDGLSVLTERGLVGRLGNRFYLKEPTDA